MYSCWHTYAINSWTVGERLLLIHSKPYWIYFLFYQLHMDFVSLFLLFKDHYLTIISFNLNEIQTAEVNMKI